ncbi:hypothetical protein QMN58_27955, partial [Escherichia coli]|nr:hypothetical protein [Escherichia coli]
RHPSESFRRDAGAMDVFAWFDMIRHLCLSRYIRKSVRVAKAGSGDNRCAAQIMSENYACRILIFNVLRVLQAIN